MRALTAVLAMLSMVSCGANEVIIRVEGDGGNKVRLDADEVQPGFNHLVDAGSFDFGEVREGTYAIRVVTSELVVSDTLKVEPAPMTEVRSYGLTVTIPRGRNGAPRRSIHEDREAELYEYCNDARTLAAVIKEFDGDEAWVRDTLARYLERDLMVSLDDRYLSLALPCNEHL